MPPRPNPLCGPNGAAPVYAPQKGATPEDVDRLDAALFRYAQVLRRHFGIEVASMPGGGAAGGLAAGLAVFLGARIRSGFDLVADTTGFAERLAGADLVVTGEGRFDSQSSQSSHRALSSRAYRRKAIVVLRITNRRKRPSPDDLGHRPNSKRQ